MRILFITQKMDKRDPVLGFVNSWVLALAKKSQNVEVICLQKGEVDLSSNVSVYSLGKENGASRFSYVKNFYKYLWKLQGSYDKVFVHMNQEYVLLGGLYWKIIGVPVYMWRNHPKGDFLTSLSVFLSKKVFCTSTSAFVAKFEKTIIMPVGNDTNFFSPVSGVIRKKRSICMLGRIAPIKRIDLALLAVNQLIKDGVQISLSIIGSALEKDKSYLDDLKEYINKNNLSSYINIQDEVSFDKHPEVFSGFEINLNLTETGSFDKTILGGTSCGAIPIVSNTSLSGLLPDTCITSDDPKEIAESVKKLLNPEEQIKIQNKLRDFVESQSLDTLMNKLLIEMK